MPGVWVIENAIHKDPRGVFVKTHHLPSLHAAGLIGEMKESYYTESKRGVIRGMHFQVPPHDHVKIVTVITGRIVDVLLDLRQNSPSYGQHFSMELSRENGKSLYIPKGIAHGFCALEDQSIVYYQVSSAHAPDHDKGVHALSFGFEWPVTDPIMSARDANLPRFKNFSSPFQDPHDPSIDA